MSRTSRLVPRGSWCVVGFENCSGMPVPAVQLACNEMLQTMEQGDPPLVALQRMGSAAYEGDLHVR